jgi:hypothetical protein
MPPQGLSQKERQEWLKRRTRKQEKDKARAARGGRGDATPDAASAGSPTDSQKGGLDFAYRSSKYGGFDSSSSWTPATSLGKAQAAQDALIGDAQDDVGDMSAAQAKASQRRRATELKGKANLAAKERERWVDEQSKKVMAKEAQASANEKLLKRLEKDSKKAEKDAEKVCCEPPLAMHITCCTFTQSDVEWQYCALAYSPRVAHVFRRGCVRR